MREHDGICAVNVCLSPSWVSCEEPRTHNSTDIQSNTSMYVGSPKYVDRSVSTCVYLCVDIQSHVTHRRLDSSGKKKKERAKKIKFPPPLWVI